MRHAVVLAGGSGTRLWPASRQHLPKQFLALAQEGDPLVATAVDVGRAVAQHVAIVGAAPLVDLIRALVPGADLIAEPVGRNTAAAIGLAGATLEREDPDAVIVVLPADHHVQDRKGLVEALKTCLAAVELSDAIALIGVPPTRPETGYGYLEIAAGSPDGAREVLRFVEKPDAPTAANYLAEGRHLWNAGIFCLSARRLLAELDEHLPETASVVRQLARDAGPVPDPQGRYAGLPSISFDHAVMEKTRGSVVAVPAAVGWSDVGAWSALPEVRGTDGDGNTVVGCAIAVDGEDNVIVSDDDTLVATIGVSGLVVIKSGDAILVVRKDQAQRTRELVEALRTRGLGRYL